MTALGKFFKSGDSEPEHPKLRYWRTLQEKSVVDKVKVEFWRERAGLVFKPAKIYVNFLRDDGEVETQDQDDWDFDLNAAILKLGYAARDEENESERFGMMLNHLLRGPEVRFGDTFFNAVLIDVLKRGGFAEFQTVAEALEKIHSGSAKDSSPAYSECQHAIEAVIRLCAHHLEKDLNYDQTFAEPILANAIVYYLDERFSLTNRRLMGF